MLEAATKNRRELAEEPRTKGKRKRYKEKNRWRGTERGRKERQHGERRVREKDTVEGEVTWRKKPRGRGTERSSGGKATTWRKIREEDRERGRERQRRRSDNM